MVLSGKQLREVEPRLAVVFGVAPGSSVARWLRGERTFTDEQIRQLAELLAVPEWFLLEGFDRVERPSDEDRLGDLTRLAEGIDRKLDALDVRERLAAIEAELRRVPSARL